MVRFSSIRNANAIAKPMNQPIGVRFVRTIALILSVTDAKVWPGAMTGGSARTAPSLIPAMRS